MSPATLKYCFTLMHVHNMLFIVIYLVWGIFCRSNSFWDILANKTNQPPTAQLMFFVYKFIGAGGKEKLWSTSPDSAGLECNYESIMGCWEQQKRDGPGRAAHTLCATLRICSSTLPPPLWLLPVVMTRSMSVTLAQPLYCFCVFRLRGSGLMGGLVWS